MKFLKIGVMLLAATSMTATSVAPAFAKNYGNKHYGNHGYHGNHGYYGHRRGHNGAAIGAAVGIGLLGAAAAAAAANNRRDDDCWKERRHGRWVVVCD